MGYEEAYFPLFQNLLSNHKIPFGSLTQIAHMR
nr:MAG TPA: hypothetical protein [Bacteriophage sp.]